ncbi:MAG: M20/M25/M40 family metallo-hydrolase [Candidatus Omnitrophota bacterium]|nr:M20/M25/M40 family metallo-hydrolase [Candidatus Omnitrophota bacterium]
MVNKNRLVRLTQKLVQFDSVNPPGNERMVSKFIAQDMRSLGLDVKMVSFSAKGGSASGGQKDRPNVIATLKGTWPRQRAAREALLITPHIDTVVFGSGWTFKPAGGQIHKGRIYGRGASDDKGNCAVGMEALRSLVEDGVRLKRDIVFAATVDEETGSHYGIRPLLDKGILRPKAALITDSEEFDAIIAQKGLVHCRVQIFGKKAHGAYNWMGVNAIEIAARVIGRLKKHQFKFKKHLLLVPPTKNIGTIRGGDKVNMVADFCEFSLDIRFMPGMTASGIVKEVKVLIGQEAKKFKVIVDDSQKPYEINPKDPFVKTYVDVCRKMGFKAKLTGSQGATVITFFQDHGIPAFSTGWGSHGVIHANDEYADIKTLYNGARVLEAFLKEYDGR